ncbi:hypothetical protein JRI60_01700 [Archangium violaceum]|uniref:hypothetical protein n=1 Tax=Archangium violaceum TaxID=83451 RepID=UPI00194E19D0|nr:hypothetical protein [Archangium violaceum]QRN97824.1 hypothetical protein JRI60_01700 [Archangium violaceum]
MLPPPPAAITVDDSLWPLVVIRSVGTSRLADFEAHLEKRVKCLERGPHLLLVDGMHSGMLPLPHRERQLEWMARYEELRRERMIGAVHALDSALTRLTLSIVMHQSRPSYPYIVFNRLDHAAAWAACKLEDLGHPEVARRVQHRFGVTRQQAEAG